MTRFLLTWAGAYLAVLAILVAFGGAMAAWPLWLRALVVSGLMVALMQSLIGPALARLTLVLERHR
ncbi:MAG: hypothetical protein AAGE18_09245 [Pseudomonadota bacterium]